MPITPITNTIHAPALAPVSEAKESPPGESFQAVFAKAVGQVNALQSNAQQTVEQFLTGEGGELHEVALATQKAELAFEMVQQVRNKMVQAYQEVMRMQF